jgi:CheY-like chemotaxis protein
MARRILIVEDDKHFASQLSELMEFQGLDPLTLHSGPAGIEAFRQHRVDLVLLDVMLPDVHGIRVLEAIRALPGGADVPVLLMSAVYRSESLFQRDIARLGVSGFLSKPFSLLELGRRIETLLGSPEGGRAAVRERLGRGAAPEATPAADRSVADVPSGAFPPVAAPRPEPRPASMPDFPALMRKPAPTTEESIAPVDAGRRLPSEGRLSPQQYVRILATLFHAHSSGRLVLDGARGRRTFFLLNGYPVWVEPDDPMNGLPRYLHEERILPAADVGRLASWLSTRRGSIRAGLVELGLVGASDLPALMEAWVSAEVRDGLGESGRFEFHAGDDFAGSRPVYEVNPIRAVCAGLERHLSHEVAAAALDALSDRMLGRTRTFNRLFGYVGSTPKLRDLGEFLLRPRTVTEIRAKFDREDADVSRTLWFLVHAGLVALSDSPSPASVPSNPDNRPRNARSVPGAPAAPRPAAAVSPRLDTGRISAEVVADVVGRAQQVERARTPAPTEEDLASQIVRDYVTRIDLDHYGFLGVKRTATPEQIDAAYQDLAPRYRLRNLGSEMQGDVRRQAKELLARLVQAFDELSNPSRRAAYDATLSDGLGGQRPTEPSAPRSDAADEADHWYPGQGDPDFVERVCRGLGALEAEKFRRAQERMGQEDYGVAYSILEELRGRYPSEGAILAALGWCRHCLAPRDPRVLDKALEWVDLALAFQPDDPIPLEARARILVAAEDERADAAVRRVLREMPTHRWARRIARTLTTEQDAPGSTRSGVLRSLWGKRK